MKTKRLKTLTIFLYISLFTSNIFASIGAGLEIGSACAKLPFAIMADFYDAKDDAKKALIFEVLYNASNWINIFSKSIRHGRNEISYSEVGISAYRFFSLFDKIKKFENSIDSISNQDWSNEKISDEIIDEVLSQDEQNDFAENNDQKLKNRRSFYLFLKHLMYFADSASSVAFALSDDLEISDYRNILSWGSFVFQSLTCCVDTKNVQVSSNAGITAFFASIISIFKVFNVGKELSDKLKKDLKVQRKIKKYQLIKNKIDLLKDGANIVELSEIRQKLLRELRDIIGREIQLIRGHKRNYA